MVTFKVYPVDVLYDIITLYHALMFSICSIGRLIISVISEDINTLYWNL